MKLLRFTCLAAATFAVAFSTALSPSAQAGDDYVVKVGYYNCDHMTAAPIAKEAGIFDELGMEVKVTGNGSVPQAMAAGRMDAGYVGIHGLMRAHIKSAH